MAQGRYKVCTPHISKSPASLPESTDQEPLPALARKGGGLQSTTIQHRTAPDSTAKHLTFLVHNPSQLLAPFYEPHLRNFNPPTLLLAPRRQPSQHLDSRIIRHQPSPSSSLLVRSFHTINSQLPVEAHDIPVLHADAPIPNHPALFNT